MRPPPKQRCEAEQCYARAELEQVPNLDSGSRKEGKEQLARPPSTTSRQ